MNRIKNYYIIKIQSVVRRFLIRNRLIESQKLYNLFEVSKLREFLNGQISNEYIPNSQIIIFYK